ncbi:MAG TPA: DUF308 domain-containing protein [Terriglobales bacterium]|nr:DUF308 domain-containing protein [Terriglobales bacterium]
MHTTTLALDIEKLHHRWGWLLTLGVVMMLLGTMAVLVSPAATIAGSLILSWLLIFSGGAETVYAFRIHKWGGLTLHLMGGLFGLLTGLLTLTHPVAGALAWTLLFASLLTIVGIFRLVVAISLRFPNWGWSVLDSTITVVLGALLWAEWPWSGVWFLGVALGVSLILRGWSYIMFAIAIRQLPVVGELRRAA